MSSKLKNAVEHLDNFESTQDAGELREAAQLLDNIELTLESSLQTRTALRRDTLVTWLRLLNLIDRQLDPDFDPSDVPALALVPPGPIGLQYPAGIKPEDIREPDVRKQYEELLERNQQKTIAYEMQTTLRDLDSSVSPKVERFLRLFYTAAPLDRKEYEDAIAELIQDPQRAARLRQAAGPEEQ